MLFVALVARFLVVNLRLGNIIKRHAIDNRVALGKFENHEKKKTIESCGNNTNQQCNNAETTERKTRQQALKLFLVLKLMHLTRIFL